MKISTPPPSATNSNNRRTPPPPPWKFFLDPRMTILEERIMIHCNHRHGTVLTQSERSRYGIKRECWIFIINTEIVTERFTTVKDSLRFMVTVIIRFKTHWQWIQTKHEGPRRLYGEILYIHFSIFWWIPFFTLIYGSDESNIPKSSTSLYD